MIRRVASAVLVLCAVSGCMSPGVGTNNLAAEREPDIRTLGRVTLDVANKRIRLPVWVNQIEGPIEYVVCGPRGKTHESIFVCEEPPANLQTAVLLLGVEPGTPPMALRTRGDPAGPTFDLWAEWEQDGASPSYPGR